MELVEGVPIRSSSWHVARSGRTAPSQNHCPARRSTISCRRSPARSMSTEPRRNSQPVHVSAYCIRIGVESTTSTAFPVNSTASRPIRTSVNSSPGVSVRAKRAVVLRPSMPERDSHASPSWSARPAGWRRRLSRSRPAIGTGRLRCHRTSSEVPSHRYQYRLKRSGRQPVRPLAR